MENTPLYLIALNILFVLPVLVFAFFTIKGFLKTEKDGRESRSR